MVTAREYYINTIDPGLGNMIDNKELHDKIIQLMDEFSKIASQQSFNAAREKELKESKIAWNGTTQNKYGFKYENFKHYVESNTKPSN